MCWFKSVGSSLLAVSLADYVSSNPLHDENETHEPKCCSYYDIQMRVHCMKAPGDWLSASAVLKVSVAVFLTGAIIALDETLEHIHETNAS